MTIFSSFVFLDVFRVSLFHLEYSTDTPQEIKERTSRTTQQAYEDVIIIPKKKKRKRKEELESSKPRPRRIPPGIRRSSQDPWINCEVSGFMSPSNEPEPWILRRENEKKLSKEICVSWEDTKYISAVYTILKRGI